MRALGVALAVYICAPAVAQTTSPPASSMNQGPTPNNTTHPGHATLPSPSAGDTTAKDLTGQSIYDNKDAKIGTVTAMATETQGGEQAVAVAIDRLDGLSGRTVSIPVNTLKPRNEGGYTTSLSAAELKAHAGTSHAP